MDRSAYFDNAATTPPDPRVVEAVVVALESGWANAHSLHDSGQRAMAAVELARGRVASLIGVEPEEVFFTSGATESNNWVLRGYPNAAVSPFEHASIFEPAQALGLQFLSNYGLENSAPSGSVDLVAIMAVNNEIGTTWPITAIVHGGAKRHCDATQAVGKIALDLSQADFASLSAHKFYGPKGVGALFARNGALPPALLLGGEQEQGVRAGTLNVPGIVGMGVAAMVAREELEANYALAASLRAEVLETLANVSDWQMNGGVNVSPYILSLSFMGVEGETLVIEMDRRGFAISSGAACSSRSTEPSHVLTALGLETQWLRGTIRISFGKWNTLETASRLAKALVQAVGGLRNLRTF